VRLKDYFAAERTLLDEKEGGLLAGLLAFWSEVRLVGWTEYERRTRATTNQRMQFTKHTPFTRLNYWHY